MRTPTDLRVAYQYLADAAPAVENLHLNTAPRSPQSPRRRRTWLAVAAVAAVVTAIVVVVGQAGIGRRGSQPATPPVITCLAISPNPSAAQKNRAVIESRLTALGLTGSVSSVSNGDGLKVALSTAGSVDASALCTNAALQVRPVVAAKHGRCAPPGLPTTVVCAPNDLQLTLGPTIFVNTGITSAVAQQPDVNSGTTGWTVALRLDARAQRAWSAYTSAHNLGAHAQPTGDVTTCGPHGVPCGDYSAFIVDGRVTAVSLVLAPITGEVTQLDRGDSMSTARNLAARLNPLPVPMKVS